MSREQKTTSGLLDASESVTWGQRPRQAVTLGLEVSEIDGRRGLTRERGTVATDIGVTWEQYKTTIRALDRNLNDTRKERALNRLRTDLIETIVRNPDFAQVPIYLIPWVLLGTVSYEEAMAAGDDLIERRQWGQSPLPQTALDLFDGQERRLTQEEIKGLARLRAIRPINPFGRTKGKTEKDNNSHDLSGAPEAVELPIDSSPLTQAERNRLYQRISGFNDEVMEFYGIELGFKDSTLLRKAVLILRTSGPSFYLEAERGANTLGPKIRFLFKSPLEFKARNASPGLTILAEALESVPAEKQEPLIKVLT